MKTRRIAEVGCAIGILGIIGCADGAQPTGGGVGGSGGAGNGPAATTGTTATHGSTVNTVGATTGTLSGATTTGVTTGPGATTTAAGPATTAATTTATTAVATTATATTAVASTGAGTFMTSCTPTAPLISDMEDGNAYFGTSCPKGEWFLSSGVAPATATLTPAAGAVTPIACTGTTAPGSTKCIHVSGGGQANTTTTSYDAYVSMSAALNQPSTAQKGTLDASAYTGISFYGKVAGSINLQVSDMYTDTAGGMCTTGTSQCSDHPEMALTPSATWTQYMIPFASLTQEKFGLASPLGTAFPKNAIYAVLFHVVIPAGTTPAPAWDLWVDDLTFYQ